MISNQHAHQSERCSRRGWRCPLGLLVAFVAIGLPSCRIGKDVERFDPLMPEVGAEDGLIFQGVVVESALPADALKPEGGALRVGQATCSTSKSSRLPIPGRR